ncbi:MAG: glucans biosynthesis glucosyltransferase MdoH [Hyphomicrobiaceae bacterium]|nr:MAG: glucans biosynthesis glucosyltransferase MdoH [Hyphomicrobiaceae bacterium]
MSDSLNTSAPMAMPPGHLSLTTPTGLQSIAELTRRRRLVFTLNVVTYLLLLWAAARILGTGGWTWVDAILFVCFAFGTPWTVLGFWNALIGLWVLHVRKDVTAEVAPYAAAGDEETPLRIKTAIFMTVRNEDPARAILRLRTVKASVDATGEGAAFSYFVLSDTNDATVGAAEEAALEAWKAADPDRDRIVYRRRTDNAGYKAGNVRDFCDRWGKDFALMLPLDADSLMSGEQIVRLVRMMQAHPKIGILQSLVVGMPSSSGFARIFQFGMRHGMRSYTVGQAWWVGDCGPFWGHNAVVRIKPFHEQCDLPLLPGKPPLGGHVLSHDQVEATLMRRAGYEVRVLPEERGSWEENPPTMLEFARRDVRWCQGNMQYLKLLDLPGLYPMSRFQLVWAILMFVGIPAWTLMIALLPITAWQARGIPDFPAGLAIGLYVTFFTMYLMPKIAGLLDAMLTRGGVARYGGWLRFAAGAAIELVFSFLQGAVSTIRTTIFMVGLLFGKSVTWGGQSRDAQRLSWSEAAEHLWPQTLFGIVVCGALLIIAPAVFWWSLPLTAGYLLAVPFAVLTADPHFGRALRWLGVCGIPEDFAPPREVTAVLALPSTRD